MAVENLLAAARAFAAGTGDGSAAAQQLATALRAAAKGSGAGKENIGSKQLKEAALQALKAAQQHLAAPSDAAAAAAAAEVGSAALAALAGNTPPPQLAASRYNLARRLVSARAYAAAHAEAWLLFQQLACEATGSKGSAASPAAKEAPEAASLAVGTALTLVLCCAEGGLLGDPDALGGALQAAEALPPWLSQLKPEEAAKHGEAAYRYLYKAAVGLLEHRAWREAAATCGAMLAAAGGDASAQRRALAAAGKLVGHMPEEHAAAALAAMAARASVSVSDSTNSGPELSAAATLDLLGLLSSAAQRATTAATARELQQAASDCAASGQPLLQTAALLMPALVLQLGTADGCGSAAAAEWVEPVAAAVALVINSIQQIEQAAEKPKPLLEQQRQLAILEAAVLPLNTLRRTLAPRLPGGDKGAGGNGDVVQALGGIAAADAAAAVLELLAGAAGVGSRHAVQSGGTAASLASQGHAAAVGLVTAARLRAACAAQQSGGSGKAVCSSQAVVWLLGWDLPTYCTRSELPPASCAVEAAELGWLASALFNVGVDLHASQRYAAAASAMQAAVAAAAVGLRGSPAESETGRIQDATLRLADFCRKCVALSDAQQQAGDAAGALGSLGRGLALLLQLGAAEPAAWRPLVQAFVRLQAELPTAAEQPVPSAAAARRGRGAASKKAAAVPAGSKSGSSSQAAAEMLLVGILQQHAAQLPAGSLADVVEQELQCWAAQGVSGVSETAGPARLAQRLLQDVFPASQQPVEHAGVLLALHQLGLAADDGQGGAVLLERAVAVLCKAREGEAAGLLARAQCQLAVDTARQLASQALLEQRLERQRSHAAASTSAVGSQEQDVAAVGQLAGSSAADAAGWQRVQQQAKAAVEALHAAGACAAGSAAQLAFEELAWLLGLHGSEAVAELDQLLPTSSGVVGPSDVLASCLFPGALGTAAELQQAAEAAATEGGRSGAAAIQRAALHGAAAEAFAADGDMVLALFHASEAHRLLATLFHGDNASSSGCSSSGAAPPSWWRLAAAYLGSLLQMGQLFEAAGLADEALHALREGQRLAVATGARPLAALFGARLADVYCKQGQAAVAEQAVAVAERQVAVLAAAGLTSVEYCRAAVQLARAQLGVSSACSSVNKAVWLASQAAVGTCHELAAAPAASRPQQWCSALHAAALLLAAEAALGRGDRPAALQQAAAALVAANGGGACSAARHHRAAALLFLGQHAAPHPEGDGHLAIWGLGQANACPGAEAPAAPKGRARKAPAKQPAGRGRSKAAAAAEEEECPSASTTAVLQAQHLQHLWAALELSRGQLVTHRMAAAALAEACGHQGRLHLAAWLLHSSLGASMRLQYQLVLYSRQQQLAQRQRRGVAAGDSGGDLAAQQQQLEEVAAALEPGLDWHLVAQLAGTAEPPPAAPAAARGRKAAAPKAAAARTACDLAAALAALEQQAQQQLRAWQVELPGSTAACSVSVLPSSSGGSLLISRLAPAGVDGEAPPPLLVCLPVQQLSASLSQHPIRALRMDDDDGPSMAVSSVQSVLDEMQAVLADSGRSMRELSTDTKEEQREWWRARLALEDRLAALVKHLGSSWLGPWRCLLLGDPLEPSAASQAGLAAAERLLELLGAASGPPSAQQAAILCHASTVLALHASDSGGMTPGDLRQAVRQLCHAAGLACSQEQQHELEVLLAAISVQAAAAATAGSLVAAATGDTDMPDVAPAPTKARRAGGKSVKFSDDMQPAQPTQQQQEQQAAEQAEAVPATTRASRGRRAAPVRGRKAAAAAPAAEADEEPEVAARGGSGDASPIATLGALDGDAAGEAPLTAARDGLCQVFDSLTLGEPAPSTSAGGTAAKAAGTTARSSKHRSRLRMMQAGTPGPATARRAAAATAPRPARELPLTAANTAPPAAPHSGSEAAAATRPVLLVLDGALQALPWESAPGLLRQRLYRMPNLACAAASAQRASTSVDLASTFYALNPSGDLAATQATFQDWFAGMRGWEGKAGSAPTATELAAALTSRQLFLYCGHGGGEQYISAAKLRSLERCSAALLMGCSSGRLRAQQHYEPAGAVLAYLLAGCPAAVANLWDVTDKDIDRFSQALLTAWISGGGGGASSGEGGSSGADVCAAVGASRSACKLPHLVGAAPVCYGIPCHVVAGSGSCL